MDRSSQLDEIDSLQSIYYAEEFQVTDTSNQNEQIQAIFWAFCKLPEEYAIKFLLVPGSHEPSYLKVKHLPPIELRLTFPKDYPSKNPPIFVISCKWLPKSKISLLCKKLDELWSEYGPVEIVYIWCDFLKNDALSFLGYENELDLRELNINLAEDNEVSEVSSSKENVDNKSNYENNITNGKENQSISGTSSDVKNSKAFKEILDLNIKMSPLRLLENYNIERDKVQFLKNFYTCNICFSDKIGKDCTKFQGCNHVFCISCIKSYFTIKIRDGMVQSIKCPEDKCSTEALPSQVKEIVSEELFAKYDSVLLNTALDTLSDIIYCPRQFCQYPVSWEPKEKMASCPNCQYVFCVTCKMVYHGIEPCQFKSVKKLIEEYENASYDVKAQLENKYGKKHLETLLNNSKAEAWIKDNSKTCPKCEVAIEKSHGCNKMVCWKCNAYFCWLCSALLDVNNPYLHFRDPHSKCANKLFYLVHDFDDEEDDWDWLENEFPDIYLEGNHGDDDDDDYDYDYDYDDEEDDDDDDDEEEDENDLARLAKQPL
ncbi:RING finger protein, putative [Pediculus humanus corporis]|uniref:RBR-type E3 ubiquitin transferase n=1 Tax=Pediculus humanus subsp. corporis TaxID=121224 RepID=E0VFA3_PEDHC|nr:RING finger protein, putative [Pediculus humanus corporis]EEB12059.1 RING finger protein, putative [Pediculus humanus corporis]